MGFHLLDTLSADGWLVTSNVGTRASIGPPDHAVMAILAHLEVRLFKSRFLVSYSRVARPVSLGQRLDRLDVALSRALGRLSVLVI